MGWPPPDSLIGAHITSTRNLANTRSWVTCMRTHRKPCGWQGERQAPSSNACHSSGVNTEGRIRPAFSLNALSARSTHGQSIVAMCRNITPNNSHTLPATNRRLNGQGACTESACRMKPTSRGQENHKILGQNNKSLIFRLRNDLLWPLGGGEIRPARGKNKYTALGFPLQQPAPIEMTPPPPSGDFN